MTLPGLFLCATQFRSTPLAPCCTSNRRKPGGLPRGRVGIHKIQPIHTQRPKCIGYTAARSIHTNPQTPSDSPWITIAPAFMIP